MKRKAFRTTSIVVAIFMIALIIGCSKNNGSGTSNSSGSKSSGGEVIRVGTMPNHIGLPVQYALSNGLYEEAGLNVELILFPTGAPINEALSAEQVDIAASGMASVFALASGECYWLGDMVKSVDGLGVYVREGSPVLSVQGEFEGNPEVYGSAETVKGLTILGALGSSDQFNVTSWVQGFGLTGNDVQMLNMDRGPAVQAFKAGEGDAIACGGPPYNYELEDAGFIEVADLTAVSGGMSISDGFLGRKVFVDEHRDDVKKFLEVTYKVVDAFFDDDNLVQSEGMAFYNDNGKDYSEEMMRGEVRDKDYIGFKTITAPDYKYGSTMIGMGGFYVEDGKIEPELEENIYTAQYPDLLEEIWGVELEIFKSK